MNESNIMNTTYKQQYCVEIYENNILKTMNFLNKCKMVADSYNNLLPVACFTNFRDALFHFRKLYYAAEKVEIFEQGFAIKEHLNRAKTDAIISLLTFFSNGIRKLLQKDGICNDLKKQLRFFLHKMQRINLFKRANGMMVFSYDISRVSDNEIIELILDYSAFINNSNLVEMLAQDS